MNSNEQKNYTQGPWKAAQAFIENSPCIWVVTNGKWGAPNIAKFEGENAEADAMLCAAAPELLDALKAMREFMSLEEGDGADEQGHDIAKLVDAAIAKAEGRP